MAGRLRREWNGPTLDTTYENQEVKIPLITKRDDLRARLEHMAQMVPFLTRILSDGERAGLVIGDYTYWVDGQGQLYHEGETLPGTLRNWFRRQDGESFERAIVVTPEDMLLNRMERPGENWDTLERPFKARTIILGLGWQDAGNPKEGECHLLTNWTVAVDGEDLLKMTEWTEARIIRNAEVIEMIVSVFPQLELLAAGSRV